MVGSAVKAINTLRMAAWREYGSVREEQYGRSGNSALDMLVAAEEDLFEPAEQEYVEENITHVETPETAEGEEGRNTIGERIIEAFMAFFGAKAIGEPALS